MVRTRHPLSRFHQQTPLNINRWKRIPEENRGSFIKPRAAHWKFLKKISFLRGYNAEKRGDWQFIKPYYEIDPSWEKLQLWKDANKLTPDDPKYERAFRQLYYDQRLKHPANDKELVKGITTYRLKKAPTHRPTIKHLSTSARNFIHSKDKWKQKTLNAGYFPVQRDPEDPRFSYSSNENQAGLMKFIAGQQRAKIREERNKNKVPPPTVEQPLYHPVPLRTEMDDYVQYGKEPFQKSKPRTKQLPTPVSEIKRGNIAPITEINKAFRLPSEKRLTRLIPLKSEDQVVVPSRTFNPWGNKYKRFYNK